MRSKNVCRVETERPDPLAWFVNGALAARAKTDAPAIPEVLRNRRLEVLRHEILSIRPTTVS